MMIDPKSGLVKAGARLAGDVEAFPGARMR